MLGEVVYDGNDSRVAPDIIFGVGDDAFQPLMDSSDLSPCRFLRDWTAADPTRLLKLILVIRLVTCFWEVFATLDLHHIVILSRLYVLLSATLDFLDNVDI